VEIIVKIRASSDVPDSLLDDVKEEIQSLIEAKVAKSKADRT
jgi:hypothetical protein